MSAVARRSRNFSRIRSLVSSSPLNSLALGFRTLIGDVVVFNKRERKIEYIPSPLDILKSEVTACAQIGGFEL